MRWLLLGVVAAGCGRVSPFFEADQTRATDSVNSSSSSTNDPSSPNASGPSETSGPPNPTNPTSGPDPSDSGSTSSGTSSSGSETVGMSETTSGGTGSEASSAGGSSVTGTATRPCTNRPSRVDCDAYEQDCAEGTCRPYADAGQDGVIGLGCFAEAGFTQVLGAPCDTICGPWAGEDDECGVGQLCDRPDNTGTQSCRALCSADPIESACPVGLCYEYELPNDEVFGVCRGECSPVDGNCPGGEACRLNSNNGLAYCGIAGEGGQGASCENQDDCGTSFACVPEGATGVCARFCNAYTDVCPNGDVCRPFFDHDGTGDGVHLHPSDDPYFLHVGVCVDE